MTSNRLAVPLLALAICAAPALSAHAQEGPPPPPPQQGYDQGAGGWDAPPASYHDDMERRAFHDGIQSARNDMDAHRPLDYRHANLYHHPPVPGPSHDEYRNAFERGYNVALHHAGVPNY